MRLNKKYGLALVTIALGVLTLALASPTGASHLRPKGATPLRDSLLIAQKPCAATTPNGHSSPPPSLASCGPPAFPTFPQQTSNYLTAGEPTVNGAQPNFIGFVLLKVVGSPNNDVQVTSQLTDVRCLASCGPTNSPGGDDYTGQLQLLIGLQVTDHFSNPGPTTGATAVPIQFPVTIQCNSTVSTMIGSTCVVTTTMNTIVPGFVQPMKRAVFEIPQGVATGGMQVFDGGSTGVAGASNATLFAESGVFVP